MTVENSIGGFIFYSRIILKEEGFIKSKIVLSERNKLNIK